MMSLIEVTCPHCSARGQIMLPPVGAIIIGPCPQCNELVVVFCGHILPLDKQIMENGILDERREHLLSVLVEFLTERIGKLMSDEDEAEAEPENQPTEEAPAPASGKSIKDVLGPKSLTDDDKRSGSLSPISLPELERFASIDLKLLDNRAYFKSVFEKS